MKKTLAEQQLEKHIPALISLWRETGKHGGGTKNRGSLAAVLRQAAPLSKAERDTVSRALLGLQRGLTGSRELAGAGYMENNAYLGAYLLYYWCVSYLQVSYAARSAAEQCRALFAARRQNGSPVRILDAGSGPAPASMAVCDLLCELGAADESFSCGNASAAGGTTLSAGAAEDAAPAMPELQLWDSSGRALSLAEKLYAREFPGMHLHSTVTDFQHSALPSIEKQDIIVMSHALNELWPDAGDSAIPRRAAFLQELCGCLADDGLLLLCEPALLTTSRNAICLRNELLRCGFHVLSPCPADAPCPALAAGTNQTCHAEIAWQPPEPVRSLAEAARLDRNSVKMTFFVLSRQDFRQQGTFRVVSDAMLNKSGRVRYLLCDGEKRIALSAKKGDAHAEKEGFFRLKRYDSLELEQAEQRGEQNLSYGITENTKLHVQQFR